MAAPAPIPAFAPVLREDFEEESASESAREVGVGLMGADREDPGVVDSVGTCWKMLLILTWV